MDSFLVHRSTDAELKRLQGRSALEDWRLPTQRHFPHEAMVGPVTGPATSRAKDMPPNLPEAFPLEALLQLAKILWGSCIDSKVAEVDDAAAAAAAATTKVDMPELEQEK